MKAPDYRIDGFEATSDRVEYDFMHATLSDDMYTELAAHHTTDNSFLLFYDRSAIWGAPGMAEYVGMHIQRDRRERTFTFDRTRQPTVPLTQNWLISQGCSPEVIELDQPGPRPADALTSRLESRLRTNPDGRYTLLDDYTHNPSNLRDGVEASMLVHDAHPDSAERPYRVFLEETAPSLATYSMREGAFTSAEAAQAWLQDRDGPLPSAPEPPSTLGRRAAAARTQTTTSTTVGASPARPREPQPPGTRVARSRGGRS